MQIKHKARKVRNVAMLLLLGLIALGSGSTGCTTVNAETSSVLYFDTKIAELKLKFPDGKYWNHVGMSKDNSDSYTNSPCTEHKSSGVDHVSGTGGCTCNHFTGGGGHLTASQCMGFANKLGYDVFGSTTWVKRTDNPVANIKIGDIVRVSNSHSVFVIERSGTIITVGEANYPNSCIIAWGRKIDLATVTITYYERANNYDAVMSGATVVTTPVTADTNIQVGESKSGTTTGWKEAEDGDHTYYLKDGVIQKKKWITVDNKKYYLDEHGYKVTGFYDIGNHTYYFDNDGACVIRQWFDYDKESYYSNDDGVVLKSQWLVKDGIRIYVKEDGSVARSELVKVGSNTYYFNSKGKRSKGFKQYNGKYYYTNKDGIVQKKKWVTKSGKKYYLQKSGVRATDKLLKIGKYNYYFNVRGQMIKKKKITFSGKIYKADKYGHCQFLGYSNR